MTNEREPEQARPAFEGWIATYPARRAHPQGFYFEGDLEAAYDAGQQARQPEIDRLASRPYGQAAAVMLAERDRLRELLRNLVRALDAGIDPDSLDVCPICKCSDPEYDEPHSPDCAYLLARQEVSDG